MYKRQLYQGTSKLLDYQHGRVYLTNRRIIYVPETGVMSSNKAVAIALDLLEILQCTLHTGFLTSSPKLEIILKHHDSDIKRSFTGCGKKLKESDFDRAQSPSDNTSAQFGSHTDVELTWICPICFLSNTFKLNGNTINNIRHEIGTAPKCAACGVAARWSYLQKSMDHIANSKKSQVQHSQNEGPPKIDLLSINMYQCPRCTFVNHPSMVHCEMCGATLPSKKPAKYKSTSNYTLDDHSSQSVREKVGTKFRLELAESIDDCVIKLSFRLGGEHNFYKKLCQAMQTRDWENVQQNNGVNKGAVSSSISKRNLSFSGDVGLSVGIHGLQTSFLQKNYETSLVLNDSLQDLNNISEKGIQLIRLGQQYQNVLLGAEEKSIQSNNSDLEIFQTSHNTMKTLITMLTRKGKFMKAKSRYSEISSLQSLKRATDAKKGSSTHKFVYNLYLKELSRHICEFLVEEDILEKRNGVITLYELYASYNEACGFDIATPEEVLKAILLFSKFNFNYVLTGISLTKKEETNTSANSESELKVYIISWKKLDSSSVMGKILQILSSHPGLSILQIQKVKGLQISYIVIESFLNKMLKDGIIVIDKTLEGEFFYPNILVTMDSYRAFKSRKLDKSNVEQKESVALSSIFKAGSNDKNNREQQADAIFKELAGLKF